jgi:multidrug efflux system outer membrane protein
MRPGVVRAALALLATVLAGCAAVGPDHRRPDVALPPAFRGAAGEAAPAVQPRWWTLYGDATLTRLVDEALARNTDARAAAARVDETAAVLAQARAALFPQIDLQGGASRTRASTVGAVPIPSGVPIVQDVNRLVLSTSFELDVWGRLRRADEAARAQALASRYAEAVVGLALAGATAQTFFALRALDAQTVSVANAVDAREASLELARQRVEGGVASELDVRQASASLADARVQWRELRRQRALVEHQIAVLTGTPGATVPPGDLATLPVPPVPPAGLPSSLLERRPDVRQAEASLASATALIGVAKAQQYPTFSLTGLLGGQAAALQDVVSGGGRVWSVGGAVFWPILDAGRYRARTREAEARAEQAAAVYEKTVQGAWREVADALETLRAATDSQADVEVRLEAAREALRITQIRYEAGYSAYLEVLDAQRTVSAAELSAIQNRQARLTASVDVMKSLGGGWQAADALEAHPR